MREKEMSEEELKEVNEVFLEFFGETYTDMENRKKEKPSEIFCCICGKNLSDDGVVLVNENRKYACTDHFEINKIGGIYEIRKYKEKSNRK